MYNAQIEPYKLGRNTLDYPNSNGETVLLSTAVWSIRVIQQSSEYNQWALFINFEQIHLSKCFCAHRCLDNQHSTV